MDCPLCKTVIMVTGKAIDYHDLSGNVCTGFGRITLREDQVKLITVLKCPECGHSDDGRH